jgi:hypothetical protein
MAPGRIHQVSSPGSGLGESTSSGSSSRDLYAVLPGALARLAGRPPAPPPATPPWMDNLLEPAHANNHYHHNQHYRQGQLEDIYGRTRKERRPIIVFITIRFKGTCYEVSHPGNFMNWLLFKYGF